MNRRGFFSLTLGGFAAALGLNCGHLATVPGLGPTRLPFKPDGPIKGAFYFGADLVVFTQNTTYKLGSGGSYWTRPLYRASDTCTYYKI